MSFGSSTSKVHKIRTMSKRRMNLLGCFGKSSPPRCRKLRPPRKAAAAAAILCQYIRKQSPITGRKKSPESTEFGLQCQKCKRHSFETRISKCVTQTVRHHDQDEREAGGAMHWDVILPVLKERFQNQLEREFTDEDWLHCLYLGCFTTRFGICKDENDKI